MFLHKSVPFLYTTQLFLTPERLTSTQQMIEESNIKVERNFQSGLLPGFTATGCSAKEKGLQQGPAIYGAN